MLVVANAAADGTSTAMADHVAARYTAAGWRCQVRWTAAPGVATALASAADADLIIGLGGDGTARELAEGLVDRPDPPTLLVLPAGTGNSLCRSLWGERDWRQVLELALDDGACRVTRLDLLHVLESDRFALLGASAGFLGETLIAAKAVRGVRGVDSYRAGAAAVLANMPTFPASVQVDGAVVFEGTAFLVNAGGGCFRAAGMLRVLPHSVLDDGLLDLCVIAGMSAEELAELIPMVSAGEHLDHPHVTYRRGRRVTVARLDRRPLVVECDGDVEAGFPNTMTVEVRAGAIPALAPVTG